MRRRRPAFVGIVAALALALLVVYPALATPPPHAHAKPTTSHKPKPTTTTMPATTTTGAMPTTTVTMGMGVPLTPASDVQAALDANPNGSTFSFGPGTYRPPAQGGYVPKAGQQLIGRYGAVLNGAKVLSGWTVSGATWWASAFLPGANNGGGECESGTLCTDRQDVWRDGGFLTRVGSQAAVVAGTFFTDYAANRVYVGDDPNGHVVEQAWNSSLVGGSADGVTLRNFTIQMAANNAQVGAVQPSGDGWEIAYNEVRLNHGRGIYTDSGDDHHVHHNWVHHQGQMGVGGAGNVPDGTTGRRNLWEFNRIDHNNTRGFNAGWEAGGSKFSFANELILRGNYVHDNLGPGLWADGNVSGTVEDNYIADNRDRGVFWEISYAAIIRNNTVLRNAAASTTGFYSGGQIVDSCSRDVEIYGNFTSGVDGIGAVQLNRESEAPDPVYNRGTKRVVNLNVHDNEIHGSGASGDRQAAGLQQDYGTDVFTSDNNHFEGNIYHAPSTGGSWFAWQNAARSFSVWQGTYGHDTPTGSIDTTAPSIPSPPTLTVGPQP